MREDLILTIILVLVVPVMAFMIYKFVGIFYEFYILKKLYLAVDEKAPGADMEMVEESKTYIQPEHKHNFILSGKEEVYGGDYEPNDAYLYFECSCGEFKVALRSYWRKMWTNSQD